LSDRARVRDRAPPTLEDAIQYDVHVVPRYSALFGRMLLAEIPSRERLQVLDVGCGTGYPAIEILRHLGEGSRVIAIDSDSAQVDLARRRALDDAGKRIFFKVESAEQMSFGDEVFDVVVANVSLSSVERPDRALTEMRRVLAKAGQLVLTQPLAGTFEEVVDMFRELALKHDRSPLAQRVERVAALYPTAATLEAAVAGAGFTDVRVVTEELTLPFQSASSIFTDPMIRVIALPEWRWIAGFEDGSERLLDEVQRALETYFGRGPLSLRVMAGLVTARA
jgi:ubiquinone/menaquinone biosynthesis C-methylase UbiE